MKNLLFILLIALFAVSCNRDEDASLLPEPVEEKFDINNPAGNFIVLDQSIGTALGLEKKITIFEFLPNQSVKFIGYQVLNTGFTSGITDYIIETQNTIVFDCGPSEVRIKVENQEVVDLTIENFSLNTDYYVIYPKTENILRNTLFKGEYRINENNVLHANFFYNFHATQNKVDAGLNVGNVLRTDNYESIGNFGAFVKTPNSSSPATMDEELLVSVDGKLLANYWDKQANKVYYGTFTKQ